MAKGLLTGNAAKEAAKRLKAWRAQQKSIDTKRATKGHKEYRKFLKSNKFV